MAKEISKVISQGPIAEETIAEGHEPLEFWQLLGGKAQYANDKRYHILNSFSLLSLMIERWSEYGTRNGWETDGIRLEYDPHCTEIWVLMGPGYVSAVCHSNHPPIDKKFYRWSSVTTGIINT